MLPVQSPFAKIFPFSFDPNHFHIVLRSWPNTEGAFRDRHERRAGMRWTRAVLLDESAYLADGEVVWSRTPDGGVKFAEQFSCKFLGRR